MKRLVLGLGLVALAVITTACSGGSGSATASPAGSAAAPSAAGDGIVLVAKNIAYSPTSLTAPADEAFQILLDNQESVPHNVAIKDASGTVVFKGEIVVATQVTNNIPALAAGAYEFFCEVHPDMKGTLTAE